MVKILFGSHLYGTATPESDTDYKGVALQPKRELIIHGPAKHTQYSSTGGASSKNTCTDIDIEIYTLHEFLRLALQGQTVAVDMLHAPHQNIIETSKLWEFIQTNRSKLYSKQIHSYLGYCQKQAAKYSIKGSRLHDVETVLAWLAGPLEQRGDVKLEEICQNRNFPIGRHIKFLENNKDYKLSLVEVCGKKFTLTTRLSYIIECLNKYYTAYGERAKQAQQNNNVDFKAISHAFRAGHQMKELFTTGDLQFPLKSAKFLTDVKLGQIPFIELAPQLEDLIDEVQELRDISSFPETPDTEFWETFLFETYEGLKI